MNRLLILLFYLSFAIAAFGQEHVFILVDVSGSRGSDPIKIEAKQQVYNLILGQYSSNGWNSVSITDKKIADLINSASKQSLISQNSWFCIIPFGNKDTYKKYTIGQNKVHPTDFQTFFNQNYPSKFAENYTYIQIAEAFTASLAKTYGINEYYMFVVTDGLGDQDATNSKNNYDSFEESLLLEWNNSSSSIVSNIGTLAKSKYYINLKKITNVKSSQIPTNPGITPPASIVDTGLQSASITITSPPEVKKNKETELSKDALNITWKCNNCPQGVKYTVVVSEYDGGKFHETKKDLLAPTATFKVPDGKFKITVSAQNYPASFANTFVKIDTGGYFWLLLLLLLAVLIFVAYRIWKSIQNKDRSASSSEKAKEKSPFGNAVSPQTTNSKHY